MTYLKHLSYLLCAFLCCQCDQAAQLTSLHLLAQHTDKIDGLSFVAPPRPFEETAMADVVESGANWIAVIPYGFTRLEEPRVYFNSDRQWWGERTEGAIETIQRAHKKGLKVMLKPQVYVPRAWTGAIDFSSESEWRAWEESYRSYIIPMARIADSLQVDLFCIGTEFKNSSIKRPAFWIDLIQEIRSIYSGPLTYAANWDEYEHISFWKQLDFIGIDAYFPLSESITPTVPELMQAWKEPMKKMSRFARQKNRSYLFTEFGYMSVDGCASRTWELEEKRRALNVNEQAQSNAYEAVFRVFWDQPLWAGGFIWKWYPHESSRSDYRQRDYTPQGKMAAQTIYSWYCQTP